VTGFDCGAGTWPPMTAAAAAIMAKLNETRFFMVSITSEIRDPETVPCARGEPVSATGRHIIH